MKNKIPGPISRKIWLLGSGLGALSSFGVIWGIASSDETIMMLSFVLLIAGIAKVVSLYQIATGKCYDVYEGTVILNRVIPLRKRHELQIVEANRNIVQIVLSGRSTLQPGEDYRIYVQQEPDGYSDMNLPDTIRPARTLLGYEKISTQSLE